MKTTLSLLCLLSVNSLFAQTADLSITQSTDVTRATVGQNMVYTLSAHNAGPDANPSVRVTDFLPAEVSVVYMDAACQADVIDSRLLNCNIGLNSGDIQDLTIEVHVNSLPPAGPRVYLSGTLTDGVSTGFFRKWVDTQVFDTISAASGLTINPRGVFLQDNGGMLIAERGDLSVFNPNPVLDGKIQYAHPLESLQSTLVTGGMLVNPNDVIKAPDGMFYVADANGVRFDGMGQPTADTSGRIIKIDPNTTVQTLVAEGTNISTPTGLIWRAGELIVSDLSGKLISVNPTTGVQQLISAGGLLQTPQAVTEVNGVYYVADSTSGVVSINALSLTQAIFAPSDTNGGVLSDVVDIDHFNNQELYVLNGNVLNGSNKIISRFTISTGAQLSDVDMSFDMNEVNGIDVDDGGSFLDNFVDISSFGSVVDNNFLNDTNAIATPVDAQQVAQILVQETITVSDNITVTPARMITVLENILVTDDVTVTKSVMLMVQEMINVIDTPIIMTIDPPRITKVRPISGLCHNQITSGDQLAAAVTELEVTFSTPMQDPSGNLSTIDVTNPDSYRLVSTRDPLELLPTNCTDALMPNSMEHAISVRLYDSNSNTVVIASPLNEGLIDERYHLMACKTGLSATIGGELDGNSDGAAGDDYAISFSIKSQNFIANPNFGDGINNWQISGNVMPVSNDADNAIFAGSSFLDLSSVISQCVVLNGANFMRFGTSLKADIANGDASLHIQYFDDMNCSGTVLDDKAVTKTANTNSWSDSWFDTKVPANSQSALVMVEANPAQTPIMLDRTYFIKAANIFASGFEEGAAGTSVCTDLNNANEQ